MRSHKNYTINTVFAYSIIIGMLGTFLTTIYFLSDYPGRMAAINRHYCVDIYKLNTECK